MKCDYSYKIQNIVATGSFKRISDERLDLYEISKNFPICEYNPEKFPGVIMKFLDPKFTMLLFSTRKFVLAGLKESKNLDEIINKIVKKFKKKSIKLEIEDYKVQNVVSSGKLSVNKKSIMIDLNLMALMFDNSMYEPEVFPGLIYRVTDPYAVFLVFSTGSIVCSGSKSGPKTKIAFEKLCKDFENNQNIIIQNTLLEDEEEMNFLDREK